MPKAERLELITLFITILLLFFEVFLLLYQLRIIKFPKIIEKSNNANLGVIIKKEKNVQSRKEKSLSWYPLILGDPVYENDSIMTGNKSSAQVELTNFGVLELGENSLINISLPRKIDDKFSVILNIKEGAIKVHTNKKPILANISNQKFKLTSGSETIIIKHSLAEKASIEVKKGKVELIDEELRKPASVNVIKENGFIELKNGNLEIRQKIFLSSVTPIPGQTVLDDLIEFNWDKNPIDKIEISKNADFSFSKKIDSVQKLHLPNGRYYWRVHRGNLVSETFSFLKIPSISYLLNFPKNGQKIFSPVTLKWKTVPETSKYILEISTSSDFNKKLFSFELSENEKKIGTLLPGIYYWRLKAKSEKWGEWPFSKISTFKVKSRLKAPKIKNSKPVNKKSSWKGRLNKLKRVAIFILNFLSIPSAHAETNDEEWNFEWEKVDGASEYLIQISEDKDFSQILIQKTSKEPHAIIKIPVNKKLYWRVAGVDFDGERGKFSISVPIINIVNEKTKKAKTQKTPKKTASFLWFSAGCSASILSQTITGLDFKSINSGISLNKYLFVATLFPKLELKLWYEPIKLNSNNPSFSDFQTDLSSNRYGMDFYITQNAFGLTPKFGFGIEKIVAMERSSFEKITLYDLVFWKLIIGHPIFSSTGKDILFLNDAFWEFTPFGQKRGVGIILMSRVGFLKLGKFSVEFLTLLHPYYRETGHENIINIEGLIAIMGGVFNRNINLF